MIFCETRWSGIFSKWFFCEIRWSGIFSKLFVKLFGVARLSQRETNGCSGHSKKLCTGGKAFVELQDRKPFVREQYIQMKKTKPVKKVFHSQGFIINPFSILTSFLHGNHCFWKIHLTFTFHYVPSHYAILSCNNFITLPLPTNIPFYITSAQLNSSIKFQCFFLFSKTSHIKPFHSTLRVNC